MCSPWTAQAVLSNLGLSCDKLLIYEDNEFPLLGLSPTGPKPVGKPVGPAGPTFHSLFKGGTGSLSTNTNLRNFTLENLLSPLEDIQRTLYTLGCFRKRDAMARRTRRTDYAPGTGSEICCFMFFSTNTGNMK